MECCNAHQPENMSKYSSTWGVPYLRCHTCGYGDARGADNVIQMCVLGLQSGKIQVCRGNMIDTVRQDKTIIESNSTAV